MLISFSGRTKEIFFLVIKLELGIIGKENNSVPTELDVSISALELVIRSGETAWN